MKVKIGNEFHLTFTLRCCLYILINSLTVVASSALLSSLNEIKRGKRRAYPGSSPFFPAVCVGLLVISSANISSTSFGSTQKEGSVVALIRAGFLATFIFWAISYTFLHSSSVNPVPTLLIVGNSSLSESYNPTNSP